MYVCFSVPEQTTSECHHLGPQWQASVCLRRMWDIYRLGLQTGSLSTASLPELHPTEADWRKNDLATSSAVKTAILRLWFVCTNNQGLFNSCCVQPSVNICLSVDFIFDVQSLLMFSLKKFCASHWMTIEMALLWDYIQNNAFITLHENFSIICSNVPAYICYWLIVAFITLILLFL